MYPSLSLASIYLGSSIPPFAQPALFPSPWQAATRPIYVLFLDSFPSGHNFDCAAIGKRRSPAFCVPHGTVDATLLRAPSSSRVDEHNHPRERFFASPSSLFDRFLRLSSFFSRVPLRDVSFLLLLRAPHSIVSCDDNDDDEDGVGDGDAGPADDDRPPLSLC